MKTYLNTFLLIGLLVIVVVVISIAAFPENADDLGKIVLLVGAALSGVISTIKGIKEVADALEENKEKKASAQAQYKVRHNLHQRDYGVFIGREAEREEIIKVLKPYPNSQYPVLSIQGLGGMGKSSLALETAYFYLHNKKLAKKERFQAIIWISAKENYLESEGVSLRSQVSKNLEMICKTIARTLSVDFPKEYDLVELIEIVRVALTEQRTLLILDNFETIDDDYILAFIREIPAPTKVLITTRHPVHLAYPIKLKGMPKEDGLSLINQECANRNLSLTENEKNTLYDKTGGMPLPILWSIGLSSMYSIAKVLEMLEKPTGDIARYCFENAFQQVRGNAASQLLLSIALLENGLTETQAALIADVSDNEQIGGIKLLEDLSLINREEEHLSLLPLTREYVLQDFKAGKSEFGVWDFLTKRSKNIVDAILENNELEEQANFILYQLSWMHIKQGQFDLAKELIEQVRSRARQQNLQIVEADTWHMLALLYREKGDYAAALQEFEQVEDYFRSVNMSFPLVAVLNRKADAYRKNGQYEESIEHLREALEILDDPTIEGEKRQSRKTLLVGDIGFALSRKGDYQEANTYIDECIEGVEADPDLRYLADVLATVYVEKAVVSFWLEGFSAASSWGKKANNLIEKSGMQRPISDGDQEWLKILEENS